MKVQCDVCQSAPASLVCCADEAALCAACDARVHAANKLASKHQRVPFVPHHRAAATVNIHVATSDCNDNRHSHADGTSPSPTLCDVCQEKASFLFLCVEDRSVLCRDCDVSIHSANALVSKHTRLLLTGIRVALEAITCTSSHQSDAALMPSPRSDQTRKAAAATSNPRGDDRHPHDHTPEHHHPSSNNASALIENMPSILKTNARQVQNNTIKPSVKSVFWRRPCDRNTNQMLTTPTINGKLKLPMTVASDAATCNIKSSLYPRPTVKRPCNNILPWQRQSKKLEDGLNLTPITQAKSSPSLLRFKPPGLSIQRLSLGSVSFVAPVLTTVAAAAAMAAEAASMTDDNHDDDHVEHNHHRYDEHLLLSNDDDIHHDDQNCQSTTSGETITDLLSQGIMPAANSNSWKMDDFLEDDWDIDDIMGARSLREAA